MASISKSKPSNEVIDQKKSSAEQTADIVGTSKTKVEKVRAIIDHADEQIKKDVETGNKTINKAYQETQEERKGAGHPSKSKLDKKEIISDDFTDAFEVFFTAIKNAKHRKWKNTSKEAVLEHLRILHDVTTICWVSQKY